MRTQIREAFPALEEVADEDLRQKIVDIWEGALRENGYESIHEVPWWPPFHGAVGEKYQVPHVNDVVSCAIALTDELCSCQPELDVNRDLVVAGALLHDVSKVYEVSGDETTELHDWLPHPHYAVHLIADAGLSEHLQHIALAHSGISNVEPRSIEARLVRVADEIACDGIFWSETGMLWENVVKEGEVRGES